MINKVTGILFCILFFSSCDTAINDLAVDDRLFLKYYGGQYVEEGLDVIQTTDNGYLVVGTTTSESLGDNKDILFVKTDQSGNTQWIRTISGAGDEVARKIKRVPDGGFIVIGDYTTITDTVTTKEIILFRLNNQGDEVWRRTYGYQRGDIKYDVEGGDVAINSEGNLLVVGNLRLSSLDSEVMFFVTDGSGNQIGEITLIGQENTIEHAKTVLPDPTGQNLAFIAGYTNHSESQDQSGYNIFLSNVNRDGSVPFPNIVGGLNNEFGEAMVISEDNKLMVLGSEVSGSTSRIFIKKVNIKLDTEWTAYVPIEGMDYLSGASIQRIEDGFIVLADRKLTGINSDLVLTKLDFSGNMIWKDGFRVFGGEFNDKGNAVISDAQGNIVITGRSAFTALGGSAKLCLIKTRYDGQLKP